MARVTGASAAVADPDAPDTPPLTPVPAPSNAPAGANAPAAAVDRRVDEPHPTPLAPRSGSGPVSPPPDPQHLAPPPDDLGGIDYETPRYEPAGFPLIGGNSDIGVEFGAVGTLTRFAGGVRPYVWNLDLVLAASLKNGPTGVEFAQQSYLAQLDVPKLAGGRLRFTPTISYQQTVDAQYFGRGNAAPGTRPADAIGEPGRYFQYLQREARARILNRYELQHPYDLMVAVLIRHEAPEAYEGSRLALDALAVDEKGRPMARGVRDALLPSLGVGIVVDTRDNEFFARRGVFHQIGVKYVQGLPLSADLGYGAFGAVLAGYLPLPQRVVLAARGIVDAEVGRVPFYDLFMGGPFSPIELPGGGQGIRGVSIGRYSGLVKVVGNVEARAMLTRFSIFGQSFRYGDSVFFDAGRAFDDYRFDSPRDGKGIGLKWGTGIGAYLQWGEAAIFRMDVAYSPDAAQQSPGFPFGVYVQDGTMF